jgi:DNA-binding transcriptional MerR regulator
MPNYTIAELAREFDITPRAIRFYEDQGLISPKREGAGGRTRVYSARERIRLKLTLRGKRLGLTLSEIKDLVDMYESPKDTSAQLQRFMAVLAQHREALERRLLAEGKTAKTKSRATAKADASEADDSSRPPAKRPKPAA